MNSVRMMSCLMTAWLCSACTVAPKPQPRLMTIQPPVLVRVMSISSPSVVSTIEVEATIPDSFDQSAWQLLQVRGVKVATDNKAPVLRFKLGVLAGFTGCQTINGTYQRDGVNLWVTSFYMDNQACYDVQTQHESFEWMLMQVRHIRLLKANGYLAFVDGYNNLLAEFKPLP